MVAAVVVEAPFDGPRCQFQRTLAQPGLQGLEIGRASRAGSYEAGEFGFDGGDELLCAEFFLASAVVSEALRAASICAWQCCSLASINSATSWRKRWHSAIWVRVASTAAAGMARVRVVPPTLRVSIQ